MQDQPSQEELQGLIQLAKKGDHEAYAKVYDAYVTPIYRFIAFRVDEAMVEDLVAETFIRAWEKIRSYRPRPDVPFGAWLFRIARNIVIDALRRHRPVEELSELVVDERVSSDPHRSTERAMNGREVRSAMAKLSDRDRGVLELSFFGELSAEEVASVLQMSTGSVRTAKFRALQRLQSFLPDGFQV